jgi:hypothetical protein
VLRKWCNGISSTNCENQMIQHFQPAIPITQQGQQAILAIDVMQQQCHFATTTIQGRGRGKYLKVGQMDKPTIKRCHG